MVKSAVCTSDKLDCVSPGSPVIVSGLTPPVVEVMLQARMSDGVVGGTETSDILMMDPCILKLLG